jgi:branched-subunit amino acid ABC-type transport system permease component
MRERDVWGLVLASLAAVLAFTTSFSWIAWGLTLAIVGACWWADRHWEAGGEISILGPLVAGFAFLLVFETPPEQMFLNGVVRSGIFAIGAVGLSLVYGILNLVNFAHGDFLTTGGYFAWLVATPAFGIAAWDMGLILLLPLVSFLAWDWLSSHLAASRSRALLVGAAAVAFASWFLVPAGRWVAVGVLAFGLAAWDRLRSDPMQDADRWAVAAMSLVVAAAVGANYAVEALWAEIVASLVIAAATVALLSVLLDRVLWTKMRDRDANLLTLMIVSIGVAFALRSTLQLFFGEKVHVFLRGAAGQNWTVRYWLSILGLGDIRVTDMDVWIAGTSTAAIAATTWVLQGTRVGKAMRALADDVDLARVAGIDTDRVIVYVWLLGGALAGLAGALLAMETSLHNNLGWRALLPLFAVVILGGVGSVPGALLGGIVIGMAEALSVHWLSVAGLDTSYSVATGFLILIVTLIIRPQGIMGVERT